MTRRALRLAALRAAAFALPLGPIGLASGGDGVLLLGSIALLVVAPGVLLEEHLVARPPSRRLTLVAAALAYPAAWLGLAVALLQREYFVATLAAGDPRQGAVTVLTNLTPILTSDALPFLTLTLGHLVPSLVVLRATAKRSAAGVELYFGSFRTACVSCLLAAPTFLFALLAARGSLPLLSAWQLTVTAFSGTVVALVLLPAWVVLHDPLTWLEGWERRRWPDPV